MVDSPRTLIVGAGIAGLTLANALHRRGVRPTVIEAAGTLQPPGLGLSLQPNAISALSRIGLADAVIAGGLTPDQSVNADATDKTLRVTPLDHATPSVSLHRNALIDALTSVTDFDLRLATTVTDLRPLPHTAEVTCSDGTAAEYDLVVGADGLHSSLRERHFPEATLEYRGYRAWRTIVPLEAGDAAHPVIRWSGTAGFGTFPVTDDLLYVFALERGADDEASALDPGGQVRRVSEAFGPSAQAAASRSVGAPAIYTPVYEVHSDRWADGPLVLIGDAAHAIVPVLAQGAAIAIEDAVVLADAIVDADTTAAAAIAFERIRRPRVTEVAAICGFASKAFGLEGNVDPAEMADHPGNPSHYGGMPAQFQRLWAGIDG